MSTQINSTLMGKKKAELVDIILRKDDVEKGLRKELSDVKLDFDKAKGMIKTKETEVEEYKAIIDDCTSNLAELNHRFRNSKGWNIALGIVAALLTAALLVF